MNLISLSQVMRATPWLPLVATILVGCGKTDKADSAAEEPDGRKAAPAPGRIESRPLPERTWRDQGEALFEALEPAHTGIDFGPRWDDPARFLKELLFVNPSGGICAGDYDADGWTACGGDCCDSEFDDCPEPGWVNPGAYDFINGVDDDCDGEVDEGTAYADDDGDGFSELGGDCDDDDPARNPGLPELEGDGIFSACTSVFPAKKI